MGKKKPAKDEYAISRQVANKLSRQRSKKSRELLKKPHPPAERPVTNTKGL